MSSVLTPDASHRVTSHRKTLCGAAPSPAASGRNAPARPSWSTPVRVPPAEPLGLCQQPLARGRSAPSLPPAGLLPELSALLTEPPLPRLPQIASFSEALLKARFLQEVLPRCQSFPQFLRLPANTLTRSTPSACVSAETRGHEAQPRRASCFRPRRPLHPAGAVSRTCSSPHSCVVGLPSPRPPCVPSASSLSLLAAVCRPAQPDRLPQASGPTLPPVQV